MGALGDFAGGGAPPTGVVTSSAAVQNLQIPAIPITLMAAQPFAFQPNALPVAAANSAAAQASTASGSAAASLSDVSALREDVNRLTKLVEGLAALEKARSLNALQEVEEASK